jgi:hypothetical protein
MSLMTKNDLHIFEVPGCGRVIADLSRDDLPPVIQFEDGNYCFGLPRAHAEVSPMGYESIAEGNFIHEALHMFIANRCGFTDRSVLYRAGQNADFSDREILREACNEERVVLGVQVAVNETEGDSLSTNKVGGFLLHLAAASREFARRELAEVYGCDLDETVAAFRDQLAASGCLKRVFERVPKLVVQSVEVPAKDMWKGIHVVSDMSGEFGDVFHSEFGAN